MRNLVKGLVRKGKRGGEEGEEGKEKGKEGEDCAVYCTEEGGEGCKF